MLPSLEYGFDEGVYIQQARLVLAGQLPYRDFFYHQPPLYPFTLAASAGLAPDSLFLYRLPSLLAVALCGLLVHRIALQLMSGTGAVLAALLFYTAPLQYFDLLAMPNALMLVSATAALYLVWFTERRSAVALGALLFAVSMLYKPISIATALAAGVALAWHRERRRSLAWATAVGAVGLGLAWALLDRLSEGAFTDLLALQGLRHAEGSGFELVKQFPDIGGTIEQLGIGSAIEWNFRQHARIFLSISGPNPLFPLTALATAGQILLLSPFGRRWQGQRVMLTLWWTVPLLFSIFVWEPTWQFYFVQYLPPFAILASLFLCWLWQVPSGRKIARVAVVAAVLCVSVSGVWHVVVRRNDYALVPRPQTAGESWLLFDPFLNFISGTQPGCGLIDPFNVYGERSLTAIGSAATRSRFHVDRDALIACIASDPEIRIGLGYWASWFVDEPLRKLLDGLPAERFVPMRLHYRPPGGEMPASPERSRR